MAKLGYTMITLGFLAASYAAVLHPTEINWTLFVPLGLVAVIGVVVVRRGMIEKATHADTIAANIEDIDTSTLDRFKQEMPTSWEPTTMNIALGLVKNILRFMWKRGKLSHVPYVPTESVIVKHRDVSLQTTYVG